MAPHPALPRSRALPRKSAGAIAMACAILGSLAAPVHSDEEQNRDQERNRTHRNPEPEGARRTAPGPAPAVHNGPRFQNGQGPSPRSFVSRPAPLGANELHTAAGAVIRTRANGARSDVYDPARGMAIHHALNGGRVIEVDRPDHSRVVAQAGARGFVQRPYVFQGREFAQRTYFANGRIYARFYRPYRYHGLELELYAPARFFPLGFYGWAYRPWRVSARYAWGWTAAPWYGYYGYYFTPYPTYASATYWLTDYLIASSLQAAYEAQAANVANAPPSAGAPGGAPALSPEVKQMIADEVQQDVQQEAAQARANAAPADPQGPPPAAPATGIVQRLSDNAPHVFMAGTNLDLVDDAGKECAIGPGDVLLVSMAPVPASTTADATILSSKGAMECPASAMVMISLADLQDMQNHVRETLDDGMTQLQHDQGQGGLPAAPPTAIGQPMPAAFAADAPPPDPAAGAEIAQQTQAADQAERELGSATAPPGPLGAASTAATISLGEPIEAVTATMGSPARIVDLGAKKIYVYPDLKITFQDGKVSDVQ
jgi:hypothetical protein